MHENNAVQWLAFINRNDLTNIPLVFPEIGEYLIAFFKPLRSAIAARDAKSFKKNWQPNEKWLRGLRIFLSGFLDEDHG